MPAVIRLKKVLTGDYVRRISLAVVLGLLVLGGVRNLAQSWDGLDGLSRVSTLSSSTFMVFFLALTVVRRKPIAKSAGVIPLVAAFGGTFSALVLTLLPVAELPASVKILAVTMIATGMSLSIWIVACLGRSTSVAPQARRLVTGGPYRIVRHPLYLCEEIAILGIVLVKLSPLALAVAAVQWAFQLKRMHEEEKVLRQAFPAYDRYAASVPRVIPRIRWRRARCATDAVS